VEPVENFHCLKLIPATAAHGFTALLKKV